jgi:hypothetical protein
MTSTVAGSPTTAMALNFVTKSSFPTNGPADGGHTNPQYMQNLNVYYNVGHTEPIDYHADAVRLVI